MEGDGKGMGRERKEGKGIKGDWKWMEKGEWRGGGGSGGKYKGYVGGGEGGGGVRGDV